MINPRKYFKIWLYTTVLSIQSQMMSFGSSLMYILGKLVRFGLFVVLLLVLMRGQKELSGYSLPQMINFFLIFNLLDIVGQFFFRGIYWFRYKVLTGQLDLSLLKPLNILFQVLTDRTDILDLPLLLIIVWHLLKQSASFTPVGLINFTVLAVSGFLIVTAIHILVACIGIITTEVDHTIWIYRDISYLARVPIDIYAGWIRAILTFVLPIAVVFTFPAKALMNMLSPWWVIYSVGIAIIFFLFSLKAWQISLRKYSSASS